MGVGSVEGWGWGGGGVKCPQGSRSTRKLAATLHSRRTERIVFYPYNWLHLFTLAAVQHSIVREKTPGGDPCTEAMAERREGGIGDEGGSDTSEDHFLSRKLPAPLHSRSNCNISVGWEKTPGGGPGTELRINGRWGIGSRANLRGSLLPVNYTCT